MLHVPQRSILPAPRLWIPPERPLLAAAPSWYIAGNERGRGAAIIGGGGAAPAWTATANPAIVNNGFGTSTTTFTNQAIGTASADRIVVVFGSSTFNPTTGVTCGGNAMTLAVQSDPAGTQDASVWYLNVTTGTTATIVVEGGIQFVGITVGILTGVTATPTTTAIDPSESGGDPYTTTTALTVPSTGFGLVVLGSNSTAVPFTWNVGTRDFSTTSAGMSIETGFISASGSQTPSISGPGFASTYIAAATWGP